MLRFIEAWNTDMRHWDIPVCEYGREKTHSKLSIANCYYVMRYYSRSYISAIPSVYPCHSSMIFSSNLLLFFNSGIRFVHSNEETDISDNDNDKAIEVTILAEETFRKVVFMSVGKDEIGIWNMKSEHVSLQMLKSPNSKYVEVANYQVASLISNAHSHSSFISFVMRFHIGMERG